MNKSIVIIYLFLASCAFAPAYDPVVNATLADVEVVALDLKSQCMVLTPVIIHDRLQMPIMAVQSMTKYRTNGREVNQAAAGILKEIIAFEGFYKIDSTAPQLSVRPSVVYCADKLDDIALTVDAILKPYGVLK